jgi:hypothetical protein
MSSADSPGVGVPQPEAPDSLGSLTRQRWEALKAGDVGSLPVLVFMVAIVIFFTLR